MGVVSFTGIEIMNILLYIFSYYLKFLLPVVFAGINRVRGADYKIFGLEIATVVVKVLAGIILSLPLITFSNLYTLLFIPLMIGLYILGCSVGWGKWVAIVLDGEWKFPKPMKGIHYKIVHWLANLVIKEDENIVGYSRLALVITGFTWWAPVMIPFIIFGNWIWSLVCLIGLSISFPLSEDISRIVLNNKKEKYGINWTSKAWAFAEMVYGFMQGFCLMILFL